MKSIRWLALVGGAMLGSVVHAQAGLTVVGPGVGGDFSVTNGTLLWSLVENLQPNTPPGDNSKNAFLRYYVVATNSAGGKSIFSYGELDPSFGGTAPTSQQPYIGVNGNTYSLIDPAANASGRDLANLTALYVLAVPAAPLGQSGVQSTSVNLSGLVTNPGSYGLTQLQAFTPKSVLANGLTYTGVPLYTFINPSPGSNITDEIVDTVATDGYVVALSLAELDPALGGNPDNLLAYESTGSDFPASALARTIFPGDTVRRGRWQSNLDGISVSAVVGVPEPSTWAMLLLGFAGIGFASYRRAKTRAATAG